MATTNVPQPVFGPIGFIAPTEADILAARALDVDAAMGGGLNPSPATPQGQLATSDTAIIGHVNDTFLFFTNQVDPAFAQGRMQDAIARIYFIERIASNPTVTPCICIGGEGTTIPIGATAKAVDGNLYICTTAGTIGASGNITLPFACVKSGPISCQAGTLNQIYSSISGWDSINNVVDGTLGNDVESRQDFERRRALSVAKNSVGSIASVRGAVLAVPGVIDCFAIENETSKTKVLGNYSLRPNSIYVAVVGGDAAAIAHAIWTKKSPGCDYNGNTMVTVEDQENGYTAPFPQYQVSFVRPADLEIVVSVSIVSTEFVPSNADALIQGAIVAAFAGQDGGPRAKTATEFLASRLYGPIAALGPWAQIMSVKIGSINAPRASFVGSISANVLTVTSIDAGAIVVGDSIVSAAVLPGTIITNFLVGFGGVGTYALSTSQSVTSRAMFSVSANGDSVMPNLDQTPAISAANVATVLV